MPGYRKVMPVEESDGRISSVAESRISEEDQPETSTPLVCSTQVPSNFSKTSGRHFKPLVKAMNSFVKMITPSDNMAAREYLQNVGTLNFLGCEGMGSFIPATNSAYNCTQSTRRMRHRESGDAWWARTNWESAGYPGLSNNIPDIQFVVQMTRFCFELQILSKKLASLENHRWLDNVVILMFKLHIVLLREISSSNVSMYIYSSTFSNVGEFGWG